MFADGEAEEDAATLRHVGDPGPGALDRGQCQQVVAGEADVPGHRLDQPGHGAQGGRLPRPVGAEQRDDLAAVDRDRDVADHRRLFVSGGQPVDFEQLLGHQPPAAFFSASSWAASPSRRRRPADRAGSARACPGDRLSELEHHDLVADAEHEAHVVVDQQHRQAGVGDRPQLATELGALLGVEAGGRLVEAEHLGIAAVGARDPDQLALALGELARHRLAQVLDPDQLQYVVDRRRAAVAVDQQLRQHRAQLRAGPRHGQVLGDGQVAEQLDRLPGAGESAAGPGVRAHAAPAPCRPARSGRRIGRSRWRRP